MQIRKKCGAINSHDKEYEQQKSPEIKKIIIIIKMAISHVLSITLSCFLYNISNAVPKL